MARIIVGVSGSTGIILAYKVIAELAEQGHFVELIMSSPACRTAKHELGAAFGSATLFKKQFSNEQGAKITVHSIHDIGATVASGTYQTNGMIIVPCSMATVGAIRAGIGDNLLRRCADVVMKESKPLVLCVREMPLSTLHLENLHKLASYGVKIVPPMPAWYHKPKTIDEMENHIVSRLINALGLSSTLEQAWQGTY